MVCLACMRGLIVAHSACGARQLSVITLMSACEVVVHAHDSRSMHARTTTPQSAAATESVSIPIKTTSTLW